MSSHSSDFFYMSVSYSGSYSVISIIFLDSGEWRRLLFEVCPAMSNCSNTPLTSSKTRAFRVRRRPVVLRDFSARSEVGGMGRLT